MSRYSKSYGKKSHGGAGLQFDKLIKECSNSKNKPAVAKTAGALGRFGVASFTSVRNTSFDSPVEEKTSKYSSLKKRPRIDSINAASQKDPFQFAHAPLNTTMPPLPPPPTATILKPRKFFKSRGPMEVEVDATAINRMRPDINAIEPLVIPNPLAHSHSLANKSHTSNSNHSKSSKTLRNTTNVSPPVSKTKEKTKGKGRGKNKNNNVISSISSINNESPVINQPIKLRIFKDKTTSKLVSVSDAPPPRLEEQVLVQPMLPAPTPAKRGRKPKIKTPKEDKAHNHRHQHKEQKPSGRVTRNSKRHRNSDSSVDASMPTLSSAFTESENNSTEESENSSIFMSPHQSLPPIVNRQPYQEKPVVNTDTLTKLEEDEQFQQLSEMLSSMEEGNEESGQRNSQRMDSSNCSFLISPPSQPPCSGGYSNSQQQPIDPNYSLAPPQHESQHEPIQEPPNQSQPQDIRSILEDDWDEFDDESPRKSTSIESPPKVSRFDMSAFMPSDASPPPQEPVPMTSPAPPEYFPRPAHQNRPQIPFNASPYAVRNLLSSPGYEQKPMEQANFNEIIQSWNIPQHNMQLDQPNFMDKPIHDSGNINMNNVNNFSNSQGLPLVTLPFEPEPEPENLSQIPTVPAVSQIIITAKKRQFFKHRRTSTSNSGAGNEKNTLKKRLALYKHNFGQEDEEGNVMSTGATQQPSAFEDFEDEDYRDFDGNTNEDFKLRKLRIENSGSGYSSCLVGGQNNSIDKVMCKKSSKGLFTVVKNTRPIHELQESAEVHEFDGDIFYILSDLKDSNPITIRCLSAIGLAARCMEPAFRMHLRAHGTVAEFCKELHDAPQNPTLALLAATVLFVLSQDRLNMDLDTESLKLILALTKTGELEQKAEENLEIAKHRQRIIDLCSEMKNRGHAKHLKLDKITAPELALETLLYLTSKRAGEWVKHELRSLGGLDHIVAEVDFSMKWLQDELVTIGWTEAVIERLWKIDRCLRVLQQVTFNHEDNQRYLLGVHHQQMQQRELAQNSSEMTKNIENPFLFNHLFRFCKEHLQYLERHLEPACVLREVLFSVLRVLVNLSHDYRGIVIGSEILMSMDGFLPLALHSLFQMPSIFPDEKVFDLLIHSLCLLLNVVEHSRKCREIILSATVRKPFSGSLNLGDSQTSDDSGVEQEQPALDALVEMFLNRERAAKKEETHTDDILTKGADSLPSSHKDSQSSSDSKEKNSQDSEGSSVQDTIDKLIQTAGKHMENSLIAAYISLLLAYLIMDDQHSIDRVRNTLPNCNFLSLMIFLKKLFNFMSITSTASGSTRGLKATAIALKFFSNADPKSQEELKKIIPD